MHTPFLVRMMILIYLEWFSQPNCLSKIHRLYLCTVNYIYHTQLWTFSLFLLQMHCKNGRIPRANCATVYLSHFGKYEMPNGFLTPSSSGCRSKFWTVNVFATFQLELLLKRFRNFINPCWKRVTQPQKWPFRYDNLFHQLFGRTQLGTFFRQFLELILPSVINTNSHIWILNDVSENCCAAQKEVRNHSTTIYEDLIIGLFCSKCWTFFSYVIFFEYWQN